MAKPGTSGVFVVDVSALNLPKSALAGLQKAINATVQKQIAGIDLRKYGGVSPQRPNWYGIIIRPRLPQFNVGPR